MVGARYGAQMHLANYAKLPSEMVAVRGVCSRTKESATALAQENQIAFVTDDYDALLARTDIDVMDICVPPALHHEFAIRAADAGKHIIMEKPLTGHFGAAGDAEPIGFHVPRTRMRAGACNNAEAVRAATTCSFATRKTGSTRRPSTKCGGSSRLPRVLSSNSEPKKTTRAPIPCFRGIGGRLESSELRRRLVSRLCRGD